MEKLKYIVIDSRRDNARRKRRKELEKSLNANELYVLEKERARLEAEQKERALIEKIKADYRLRVKKWYKALLKEVNNE